LKISSLLSDLKILNKTLTDLDSCASILKETLELSIAVELQIGRIEVEVFVLRKELGSLKK